MQAMPGVTRPAGYLHSPRTRSKRFPARAKRQTTSADKFVVCK
jgi:hypothetical protein